MKKNEKKKVQKEEVKKESATVQVEIKKAQKNMNGLLDITKISQENDAFVPCIIMDRSIQQAWLYNYDIKNLMPFSEIQNEEKTTKLKILMNIHRLYPIMEKFFIMLSANNLYYDVNGLLKIMDRDVYPQGMQLEDEDFMLSFKSLIAYAWKKGRSFEDYKEGGASVFQSDPFLKLVWQQEHKEDLVQLLFEQFKKEDEKSKKRYIKVEKNKWKRMKSAFIIISIIAIVMSGMGIYEFFFVKPKQDRYLDAYQAFVVNDYATAIQRMDGVGIADMDTASAYIVAKASVEAAGLKESAKNNALAQLSKQEKSAYNEYWIYLGRKDFDEAYNIADDFTDDRLLYFAYYVEYQSLTTNKTLGAAEKESRKKELETKLNDYTKQFTE